MRVIASRPLSDFGFLPLWIAEADDEHTMKECLISNYSFYMGPMTGGTLSRDGTYSFPGDPVLEARASFETADEICFIFDYAMVGTIMKETGDTWVTRMD